MRWILAQCAQAMHNRGYLDELKASAPKGRTLETALGPTLAS
jgi:hypothetical protein